MTGALTWPILYACVVGEMVAGAHKADSLFHIFLFTFVKFKSPCLPVQLFLKVLHCSDSTLVSQGP